MKEIKAFQCDYCDKYYKHKSSAKRHENRCFKNPKVKACLTCGNFITDYITVYVPPQGEQYYGDADYDQRYNYCKYSDKSFQAEMYYDRQKFQFNCCHWLPTVTKNEEEVCNKILYSSAAGGGKSKTMISNALEIEGEFQLIKVGEDIYD